MFLLIQNPGVAPVEGFTLLGVSTTRDCGVAGTIGQFGSGAKHAINTLLRAGLKLLIYCGKTRLEFATREETIRDGLVTKKIKRVVCKLGGTSSKTLDMGWCLDFGAIDWTDLSMALREFVANAIDRTVREKADFLPALFGDDLRVAIVEDGAVRARDGYTRVFVEVNPDVQRFYGELPRRFLHFSGNPSLVKESLLPKADRNLSGKRTAMVYKEGVLVREIAEDEEASVYDYNFHDGELRLDESRNSSEYDIKGAAARLFRKATAQQLVPVFKSLVAQEQTYEATFDSYYMAPSYSEPEPEQKEAWQQAWELAAGPNAVLCDASLSHTAEFVEKKGFRPKPTKAPSWISAAARCGVKTAASVLDGHESNGKQILPATDAAINAVNIVWSWLQQVNMTQGKKKPNAACFRECMQAGCETMGFYREGMVYFKEDIATAVNKYLLQTALEEVAHYVTGATDTSRDFQNFLIQVIVEIKVCPHGVGSPNCCDGPTRDATCDHQALPDAFPFTPSRA